MASGLAADMCALISNAWSWWWEARNRADELWRSILTVMVAMTIVFSYATSVKKRRRRDVQPGPPPGPRGLPLLGSLPFLRSDVHRQFAELAHEYGPIFGLRLGSKQCVVVTSASLVKEILHDHDATFANRDVPVAARVVSSGGLDIAWGQLDDPHWRPLRKLCTRELLNGASLDALRGMRRAEVRRMVGELYGKAGDGARVNLGELAFVCAVNVIMSALWGGAPSLEGETRNDAVLREKMGEMTDLLGKPNVSDFFPVLAALDLQRIMRRTKRLMGWFDGMLDAIIEGRLRVIRGNEREGASGDFLEMLLRTRKRGSSEVELSMDHIKGLLLDLLTGGSDTTSTTMEWAMAELMHNPDKMKKAQDELHNVVGDDNIVEETHLPKLKYLDAVIKETLRLHPAVPFLVPHSPSKPCLIGGHTVPKGARVLINTWAIHRDGSMWENPLKFEPERFLVGADVGKGDFRGSNYGYVPFGSGRRMCVGISLVERMVVYMMASLLHSFEWQVPDGVGEVELEEKVDIVLRKAKPLLMVPVPRLFDGKLYA